MGVQRFPRLGNQIQKSQKMIRPHEQMELSLEMQGYVCTPKSVITINLQNNTHIYITNYRIAHTQNVVISRYVEKAFPKAEHHCLLNTL